LNSHIDKDNHGSLVKPLQEHKGHAKAPGNIIHITVDIDWIPGSEQCFPRLFNLFERYNIRPTLFFAGNWALTNPELIMQAKDMGFEIGSHGMFHGLDDAELFGDTIPYDQQKSLISRATELIAKTIGEEPKIFRAPYLNISNTTFRVLGELGYKIDSSIPSRRFDFGCGSVCNVKHFLKPTMPFSVPTPHGELFELPPSAFVLPFNMRLIRSFSEFFVNSFTTFLARVCTPLVFYMHPTELVCTKDMKMPINYAKGFFRDCGPHHFPALESFFEFISNQGLVSEYMLDTQETMSK